MPSHPCLPYQTRADLFSQLAALERAGLPAERAWVLLQLPNVPSARLQSVHKAITRGIHPAVAAQQAHLFTPLEASITRAALAAGSPAPAYERLASSCSQRAQNEGKIRARMALPAATLVLALFIQPLPPLVTGSISAGAYLWLAVKPLLVLAALAAFAKWLLASSHFSQVLLKLPLFGHAIACQNALNFFESLALLLEAGVPMFEALPIAVATIDHPDVKKAYARIKVAVQRGVPLSKALEEEITEPMYMGGPSVIELIATGESSGTLPEMLLRHVQTETEMLNLFWKQVADWVPRIAYSAVVCWMVYGLLTSAGLGPRVPSSL